MFKDNGWNELKDLLEKTKKGKEIQSKNLPGYIFKTLYNDKKRVTLKGSAYAESMGFAEGKFPEISYLLSVYAALHGKGNLQDIEINIKDLQRWLIYWLHGHLERDCQKKSVELDEKYLNEWIEAIKDLKKGTEEVKTRKSALPTLDRFPSDFAPLTVITGTGLTTPPERISDLFRSNASLTDLFFLNELKLPKDTRIVSDRFVIDMSASERIEYFGNTHLLLIGGPKVNAVTRVFGKYGIFRFLVSDDEKHFQHLLDALISEDKSSNLFQNSRYVKMFYELLKDPKRTEDDPGFKKLVTDPGHRKKIHVKAIELIERLGDRESFTYDDIIKTFAPTHIIGPRSRRRWDTNLSSGNRNKDLAIVTIAPNFYNRDSEIQSFESYKFEFVSVIVAGLERLGTAAGLKALAQSSEFEEYPVGGVLEVQAGFGIDFERYDRSQCSWSENLTQSYTIEKLVKNVHDFKDLPDSDKNHNPAFQIISNEEGLDNYLKFLEKFQTQI